MADYMHLVGVESVQGAASMMAQAAARMERAAAQVDEAVRRFEQAVERLVLDWPGKEL